MSLTAKGGMLTPKSKEFMSRLDVHRESARNSIAKAQETQPNYYNLRHKDVPEEFKPGNLVLVNPHSLKWIESKGKGAKLTQKGIGPFKIQEVVNPKVFKLRMSSLYPGSPVFNIDHLRIYRPSPSDWPEQTLMPETRVGNEKREEGVEEIVGHRYRGGKLEFLVQWEGYGPQFDLWSSQGHVTNAPELVQAYKKENKL